MSNLLKAVAIAFTLAASSFTASAKQVNFEQYVDYTMNSQMQQLQSDLQAQLKQSTYTMAFAQLNNDVDMGMPSKRPVVTISDVAEHEEDE